MITVIFSIILAYAGMWIAGLLGFNTDTAIAIFMLMGFLSPLLYTVEKVYDELIKFNKKE